jgi:hypothetical protein
MNTGKEKTLTMLFSERVAAIRQVAELWCIMVKDLSGSK